MSVLEREVSVLERGICIRGKWSVTALKRGVCIRGVSVLEKGVCIREGCLY